MAISNRSFTLTLSALCLVLASCSSSGDNDGADTSAVSGGTGGMAAAGSVAGSGGIVGTGGATVASGGATVASGGAAVASGGAAVASGGATVASGGAAVASGGIVGTGGVAAVGGQPAGTGGIVETGGSGTGGSVSTGGSSGVAGPGGAGGTASAGTPGTGSSTGGSSAAGGTEAAAGASAGEGGGVETQPGEMVLRQIETRGFTFDVREIVSDGEPVLLLHGFPDTSLMWTGVMSELAANGYHCLAPDQRGYSPGARPTEVDAYRYEELIADAFALGSELGERFHLVAHDWGANIAWLMLEADPSRIASFTAISIPHYAVWARSVYEDEEMAWYLNLLDTWMTPGEGEASWTPESMRNMWTAKPADQLEQTIDHMMEPGAMTAALNWYRASDGHRSVIEDFDIWEVNVPSLLIHGSEDVGERAVTDTEPLMTGPYRVVRPEGGHFIVDEQSQVVTEAILAHLQENPLAQ